MLDIGSNLQAVKTRIAAAAQRAGRDAAEIDLLAVSKRVDYGRIRAALDAGQRALGESRVQEADEKIPEFGDTPEWHFIGPLQSNKAALAARLFHAIHSVRKESLVGRLSSSATAAGRTVDIYVQIEPAANRVADDHAAASESLCHAVAAAEGLRLVGLMTMAPYDPDPEAARPYFVALRRLRDRIVGNRAELAPLGLSMGMSGDFEVAVEEGATIVRVGTAIFGERSA